jgi:flagellar motor switch/type III secretory pathway protein FliN
MPPGQPPLTAPAIAAANNAPAATAEETVTQQALIPLHRKSEDDSSLRLEAPLARLPVELDVAVPVREFRVRHLLALEPGRVIESRWANGEDVPLASGAVQLAWSEFEVIDSQLAVRVTRLV